MKREVYYCFLGSLCTSFKISNSLSFTVIVTVLLKAFIHHIMYQCRGLCYLIYFAFNVYSTSDFLIIYAVLPLAVWITMQIAFILIGVYFPFYGQRVLTFKWKRWSLHVFALVLGLLFPLPTIIVSSIKGHSLFGPTFPPVVCTSQRRDIMIFTWLIPLNVILAVVITMLIFIFYKLIKVHTMILQAH